MHTLDMSVRPPPVTATAEVNALLDQAADFVRNADPHAAASRATDALRLAEHRCPADLELRDKVMLVLDRCMLAVYEVRAMAVHRAHEHANIEAAAQEPR